MKNTEIPEIKTEEAMMKKRERSYYIKNEMNKQ